MAIKRQALFWGSFFLAIVGFILHIHQVFTMAATLACLPLIAWLLGRHKLVGLNVRRGKPTPITAGESAQVELTVSNAARTRRIFFVVSEALPEALQAGGHLDLPVAILGPGEETKLSYELQPPHRGAYCLGPARLLAPDAIGLRQYHRDLSQADELLVYPAPLALPYLWPASAGGQQPLKPQRRTRGQGDDLYGIRDYVPGDDPRHIDWKTTARRGKLAVVEYERTESLQAMIVLDLDRRWHCGEGARHTLEYGVVLAATLLEQAYERGSTVGLLAAGQEDFGVSPLPERELRLGLYEALARAQADGTRPVTEVLAAHETLLPPRCTVAVISPSPAAAEAALYLRGTGHPLAWFVLDSTTFAPHVTADYSDLEAAVAGARGALYHLRGDLPLAANWRSRGGWGAPEAAVRHALH